MRCRPNSTVDWRSAPKQSCWGWLKPLVFQQKLTPPTNTEVRLPARSGAVATPGPAAAPGNPAGRPRKPVASPSSFDVILDRTLNVRQGVFAREFTVEEALQHRIYEQALAGNTHPFRNRCPSGSSGHQPAGTSIGDLACQSVREQRGELWVRSALRIRSVRLEVYLAAEVVIPGMQISSFTA